VDRIYSFSIRFPACIVALTMMLSALLPAYALEPGGSAEQRLASMMLSEAIALELGEGARKDQLKAADLYCRSASLGNGEASFRLGWMYVNGRGVEQDDGIAVALIQRASTLGYDVPDRLLRYLQTSHVRLPICLKTVTSLPAREKLINTALVTKTAPANNAVSERVAVVTPIAGAANVDRSIIRDQILASISQWAAAWSNQDVASYFAAYTETYRAPNSKSRPAWEEERRARIAGKSKIAVSVDQVQISVDGTTAKARFRQQYVSDRLSQKTPKTLIFVQVGSKWLIQEEYAETVQVASGS
jgi:TPR repeat protein